MDTLLFSPCQPLLREWRVGEFLRGQIAWDPCLEKPSPSHTLFNIQQLELQGRSRWWKKGFPSSCQGHLCLEDVPLFLLPVLPWTSYSKELFWESRKVAFGMSQHLGQHLDKSPGVYPRPLWPCLFQGALVPIWGISHSRESHFEGVLLGQRSWANWGLEANLRLVLLGFWFLV